MEKVLEKPYNSWLINPRLTLLVANAVLWCEIVSAKNKELADLNAVTSSKSFISFVKKHKIIGKIYGSDIKFEWKIEDGKS